MNYLQKKRLAFMSIVNRTKGFVRAVLGAPPLTLFDCMDNDSIINCTLSGNSVQDGTPTPDAPIEIESVGEKTLNLFNPEEIIAKFESGDTYKSDAYLCTTIQLKPNTTYYVKTFNPTGRGYFYISKNSNVNAGVAQTIAIVDMSTQAYPRKYENTATTDDTGCLYIGYYGVGTVEERNRILRENQILIVEGTYTAETCPEYESYGYRIPIKTSGKNMLDKGLSQIGYCGNYVNRNGYTSDTGNGTLWSDLTPYTGQTSTDWYVTNPIPIKPNTVYSYSGLQTANNPAYFFLEEDKTTIIPGAAIKTSKTFTTPSNARYIVMSIRNLYVETMMLEEGEITEYVPYTEPITTNIYVNEPLRKVGDYADYIDFKNQKVVRNIKERIFNGSENWSTYSAEGKYYTSVLNDSFSTLDKGICSHFVWVDGARTDGQCDFGGNGTTYFNFFVKDAVLFPTKDDLISFLQENNVKIVAVSETPDDTEIAKLPKLPTIQGTTVYSIDTTVQPSNMNVTYYATSKE